MKYTDYMNQFTISDKVKERVFQSVKQRAEQPVKSEGRTAAPIVPFEKKKNTFRLHPKRWIAVFVSIAIALAAIPTVLFTTRRGKDDGYSLSLDYMDNLMVDIEEVTGYSIKREVGTASKHSVNKAKAVSLLSVSLLDDEQEQNDASADSEDQARNYLYSTSESYEYGNVEYDEKGIQKVTFKKNTEVTEDVYDQNGELIDSSRKITQDELDAQINKMFTTNLFTYLQFVPLVNESGYYAYKSEDGNILREEVILRPDTMVYDADGVAEFDKTDYFSSHLTVSFVIDNSTGYIYKIENFRIRSFKNGLVEDDNGYYYAVTTDEEHNLVFTDVLPNKDATVQGVYLDNDGWTYVINNRVDSVDAERKLILTSSKDYVSDADGNVYVLGDYPGLNDRKVLTHKMSDGKAVALENHDLIRNIKRIGEVDKDDLFIGLYRDMMIYNLNGHYIVWENGHRIEGEDGQEDKWEDLRDIRATERLFTKDGGIGSYGMWLVDNNNPSNAYHWFDHNYDTIIGLVDGILCYMSIDLKEYYDDNALLDVKQQFIPLSEMTLTMAEDYYLPVGNDLYKINNVYYHVDMERTRYYHIVRTTAGLELVELTSKSYTDNVFIFQPINK